MASSMIETAINFEDDKIDGIKRCTTESPTQVASNDLAFSFQNIVFAVNAAFKEDCKTIKNVTTIVNDFDPLSPYAEADRFVPVLEGRGGSDKDEYGHRRDSVPIASAMTNCSVRSAIFQFLEENDGKNVWAVESNDALGRFLEKTAHGVIVRINPGTLSVSTQLKVDNLLRRLAKNGISVMSHPDICCKLGAKDVSEERGNIRFFCLCDSCRFY